MLKKTAWMLWTISFVFTGLFIILTAVDIYQNNYMFYPTTPGEVSSPEELSNYLTSHYKKHPLKIGQPTYYVPTGIFIESFKFINSNTVAVSGFIWQKYKNSFLKIISPGIVFPEATEIKSYEKYKYNTGGENGVTTIGWYFEANFSENFDYRKYPLDLQLISLRIWPGDFEHRWRAGHVSRGRRYLRLLVEDRDCPAGRPLHPRRRPETRRHQFALRGD